MESGRRVAISTCRAGNVIGGGDFANDRIIPDCVRAVLNKDKISVRNPFSIRPYQHVLEPLSVYLTVAALQNDDISFAGSYNVGPDDSDCITTGEMVTFFCNIWNLNPVHKKIEWINKNIGGPHEASFLKLDSSKARDILGWKPVWNVKEAISKVTEWTDYYINGEDLYVCCNRQIDDFMIAKGIK